MVLWGFMSYVRWYACSLNFIRTIPDRLSYNGEGVFYTQRTRRKKIQGKKKKGEEQSGKDGKSGKKKNGRKEKESGKEGKRKTNLKKVFPGYVLIKMIVTEKTWYIVRNTRGVTGFVGSGTDPIPLTEEEIRNMGFEELTQVNVDYNVNDSVKVLAGPLKDFIGTVTEINKEKHKVKVSVSMFGRETPVELELSQVIKV